VLKRIRETLRLSLAETARLKERIPGTLFTGTRAETERLRKVLDGHCRVSLERVEPGMPDDPQDTGKQQNKE
jgi:hypothetical protein